MHYYQFHVGDYRAATAHLSNLEDLAYRRLLDWYYDTEQPIAIKDVDKISRRIRIDPITVEAVLRDMFEPDGDLFRNSRADQEIAKFHELQDSAKRGAAKRWQKDSNATPLATNNQEPLTNNQEPLTNNQEPKKRQRAAVACPIDVDPLVWDDWLQVRKAKRAGPVTETALQVIRTQAAIVNWTLNQAIEQCAARGWQGFNATWVSTPQKTANAFPERNLAAARAIFGDERRITNDATIIDAVQTIAR